MTESDRWRLDAGQITEALNPRRVGRHIVVLDEVDSTNTYALSEWAAMRGESDGWVVFAEHQSAGRGRLGRSWHSPRSASLMFTTLLWEREAPRSAARWVLAAGVAVAEGIAGVTNLDPTIRWPNDVYIGQRKIAGILVESRHMGDGCWAIAIGIGVNCMQQAGHFPPDIAMKATSIEIESAEPVERHKLARAILQQLDDSLAGGVDDEKIAAAWRSFSSDLGARVTLRENGCEYHGRILDVNPACGLLVQLDDGGRREFDAATTSRMA